MPLPFTIRMTVVPLSNVRRIRQLAALSPDMVLLFRALFFRDKVSARLATLSVSVVLLGPIADEAGVKKKGPMRPPNFTFLRVTGERH